MSAQFIRPAPFDDERYQVSQSLKNKRFALLIWRLANAGMFLFFIVSNYLIRSSSTSWPPEGIQRINGTLPAIFSVVLLLSAIPATAVQRAIRRNDQTAMVRNIWITLALGVVFLIGLGLVWAQIPAHAPNSYTAIFYVMTGFHAVHVIVGMLLFGYVLTKTRRYTKDDYWGVEAAVVFWHFVDLVWIFFFFVLYVF